MVIFYRPKARQIFRRSHFCHTCDDRRLVGEDFEDVKKENLGLNAAGRGLKTCNADITVKLYAYEFTNVRKAETNLMPTVLL